MLYARSDIHGYSGVPACPTAGHRTSADTDHAEHFSIDCPTCELVLRTDPLWAPRPRQVPLTTDQQHDLDDQQAEAEQGAAHMGMALMKMLKGQLAGDPVPAPQLPAAVVAGSDAPPVG